MKVKICGISDSQNARIAAECGADFIGIVFAESRRRVLPDRAKEIVSVIKDSTISGIVKCVGVFVNEMPEQINEIARTCGLDVVQLSGDESPDYCRQIEFPVFKAIRPQTVDKALQLAKDYSFCEAVLFDTFHKGTYGGSGLTGDWTIAAEAAKNVRLVLAGGLNSENVHVAVQAVSPWGVDVSSGVETDGVKDAKKIEAFIYAARRQKL